MQSCRVRQHYKSWYGIICKIYYYLLKKKKSWSSSGSIDDCGGRRHWMHAWCIDRLWKTPRKPAREVLRGPWAEGQQWGKAYSSLFPLCTVGNILINWMFCLLKINQYIFLIGMWLHKILSLVPGPAEGGDTWQQGGWRAAQQGNGSRAENKTKQTKKSDIYPFKPYKHHRCCPCLQTRSSLSNAFPMPCTPSIPVPLFLLFFLFP